MKTDPLECIAGQDMILFSKRQEMVKEIEGAFNMMKAKQPQMKLDIFNIVTILGILGYLKDKHQEERNPKDGTQNPS